MPAPFHHRAAAAAEAAAPASRQRRAALCWLGLGSLAARHAAAAAPDAAAPPSPAGAANPTDAAAARPPAPPPPPPPPPPPSWAVGANVGVLDWAPSPYVDVIKSSRGFGKAGEYSENLTMARDADGWPAEPSTLVVTAVGERPGSEWVLGTWKGRYRGPGNLAADAIGGVITNIVRQGDVVTFDWVVTEVPRLILAFDGAIADLRLVRPGFDLDNHPLLHPDALNYYKRFQTLRFLDFMGQGFDEDNGEATWAGRQPAAKFHGRRSWEAMAAFFNACHAAPQSKVRAIWWNVPYRFGEADCLAMGQHLKGLLPAAVLKFPEFSNELWNSGFAGKWAHFLSRANDSADADYALANAPTEPDPYARLGRLWALQTARMARAMKTAFAGAFGSTLFPVMAGHFAGPGWTRDVGLPWLALPAQVTAFGGAPSSYIGSLAAAPYLSGTQQQLDATTTSRAMLAGLRSGFADSLAATTALMPVWRTLKQTYGIARLDAYEWQLSLHGSANAQVKLDSTLAKGAGDLVRDLAYAMRNNGFQTLCFYAGTPQQPVLWDINSFLWALNTGFAGAGTAKERAVRQLIVESGQ